MSFALKVLWNMCVLLGVITPLSALGLFVLRGESANAYIDNLDAYSRLTHEQREIQAKKLAALIRLAQHYDLEQTPINGKPLLELDAAEREMHLALEQYSALPALILPAEGKTTPVGLPTGGEE